MGVRENGPTHRRVASGGGARGRRVSGHLRRLPPPQTSVSQHHSAALCNAHVMGMVILLAKAREEVRPHMDCLLDKEPHSVPYYIFRPGGSEGPFLGQVGGELFV